jgi:hypothetical protein
MVPSDLRFTTSFAKEGGEFAVSVEGKGALVYY